MNEATSQQTASDSATEFATLQFIIASYVAQLATATLVRVVSCTNSGGVSPWGMVDVQPVIAQLAGDNTAVQHQRLFRLPYCRIQGGKNAVIIDPEVGDLGVAIFASRDISSLKKQDAIDQVSSGDLRGVTPSSDRQFSMADGLYLGGVLNGTPEQFVRFSTAGIEMLSPTKIRLVAPTVEIVADTKFQVDAGQIQETADSSFTVSADTISETADSSVTIDSPSNDIKGGGTKIDNKPFLPHTHSGVTPGGGTSGPVV
jgi:hypothetical protein